MGKRLARSLVISVIGLISVFTSASFGPFVPSTRACDPAAAPPDLQARQVGADVVLDWTGSLAVGDTWAVYRGDLNVLWDVGFNDTPLATVATAQYTDVNSAADADWDYFRVRCEGPGGDGPWSNLGFKAVRNFDTVVDAASGGDFLNYYLVSLPERLGIPDIADTSDPTPCTPTSGVGDGIVNADDLLCSWWTSGQGSLMVSAFDAATCQFLDRMILREDTDCSAAPETLFLGPWTGALSGGQGLMITVTHHPGTAPALNAAVMVGSADPARPCQQVVEPSSCTPRLQLLSIPWDGLDRQGREILCGREGRDWVYSDPPTDTKPSACDQGTFNTATRKGVNVLTFDNIDDDSVTTPDNAFSFASVSYVAIAGFLRFGGVPYTLRPTDGLIVSISMGHGSTTYCPERR